MAWSLPEGRALSRDHAVFGQIDGLTSLNMTRKEVEVMSSNGGCEFIRDTYAKARDFALVRSDAWTTQGEACRHDRTLFASDGTRVTTRMPD